MQRGTETSSDASPSGANRQIDIWAAAGNLKRLHAAAPPLVRVEGDGPFPLSFAEERLWFLSQSQPASPVYNVPLVWRITGPLDVAALEESLRIIVRRHDALRTSFPAIGGQPAAVIAEGVDFRLHVDDIGLAPGATTERDVLDKAAVEVRRPFDLHRGPLFRAVLFSLEPSTYLLVLTIHQIVLDGGSIVLFNRELGEAYRTISAGRSPSLPDLPLRYVDFAHWQRCFLQGDVLEDGTSYWSNALRPKYEPFRLPGQPLSAAHTGPAVRCPWALSTHQTNLLRQFAKAQHATEFMVFVAALQALLHAHTRSDDIIVFASTAARTRFEFRHAIGLFANVLPLRASLAGDPSFRAFLGHVRDVILSAFAHQELPFSRIIEFLQPAGNHRHDSLFQAMVVYQNATAPEHTFPSVTFQPVGDIDNGAARFQLLFDIADTKDGLRGSVKYRPDICPEVTVDRLLGDLQLLLENVLANPDIRLSALQISPADEAQASPIPEEAPSASKDRRESVPPTDALERQLVNIWSDVLESNSVGIRDNFFDLGGDSFAAVHLFVQVEALLGKRLPLVTLFEAPTIEQLASLLMRDGWAPRWSSLVPIRPGGSKPPFFCFHGVGGNVLEFEHLGRYLDPDQPLYGLQAQGLDGKKPRHKTVEEMATHYISEIRDLQPRGPYYLGGSSFGGLVAYEAAQQLLAQGHVVGVLILFDTHAPGYPRYLPGTTAFRKRFDRLRFRVALHLSNLWIAKGQQRWEYLGVKAGRLRRELQRKLTRGYRALANELLLPRNIRTVQKAGTSANLAYRPRPYLGTMTLFRATEQPYGIALDTTNGWTALALGGLEVYHIPGHHGSIMREPRVKVLANTLDQCLKKAQGRELTTVAETDPVAT